MRELDLETTTQAPASAPETGLVAGGKKTLSIAVVGAGRAGTTFAAALLRTGHEVVGPLGRGEKVPSSADVVLLCVPDSAIADVAIDVPAGPALGHCCGSLGVDVLGDRSTFALHPLMTLSGDPDDLIGAWAAIDASDPLTLNLAEKLARQLKMYPVRIEPEDRIAYHAAAAIASNFLITLEAAAEQLAQTAGLPREALVPLVSRTVSNWADHGSERSLTGPVSRGDTETVESHRQAIEERLPHLLELFDQLRAATEQIASTGVKQ